MAEHVHALPRGYRFEEYEVVRVLGSGGFGITYLAFDDNLDKAVAIKEYLPSDLAIRHASTVIPRSSSDENDFQWGLERFLDEAKTLARFKHDNIIQVHRFFRAHGTAYIVMEYAEGATLSKKLVTHGPYGESELKDMLLPIIDGLKKVHAAEYLHRDIKPGNIIIRVDGTPVLIDFGAARQAIGARSRSVTSIISPGYAPIEQYASKGNQGAWTDIYALGAVAYKCITGNTPIDAAERVLEDDLKPLAETMPPGYSDEFLRAIDAALQVNVKDRPKTLRAWKAMLLGHSDLLSLTRSHRGRRRKSKPDPRKGAGGGINYGLIAAVTGVLIVGTAGFVYWQKSKIDSPRTPTATVSSGTEKPPVIAETPAPEPINNLIRPVQVALNKLGYQVAESGVIDTRTQAAIREFERQNGLVLTGAADQVLLDALSRAVLERDQDEADWRRAKVSDTIAAYENYKRLRSRGAHVADADTRIAALQRVRLIRDIQTELVRLGWLRGGIDGAMGPATVSAIQNFQRADLLTVDGRPSQNLLQRLKGALLRAYVVAKDGTGDFSTIAAAIKAAAAGSRIEIHPGTYSESLKISKTVHLIGVGSRSQIILETTGSRAITINNGSGSVKNLTIRYVGTGKNYFTVHIDGGTWLIENNDLTNNSEVAVIAVASGNPTVTRNVIHDFASEGIWIQATSTGSYTNNSIYGGGGTLVLVEGTSDPFFSGNRLHSAITAIEVRDDAQGRFENNDIKARVKVRDQAKPTFRNNDIHDVEGNAINIKGIGGGLFETNNVYDSGIKEDKNFPSIWVSKESTARFIRNRVYGTGWPDIYLECETVSNECQVANKSVLSGNDIRS
ncbi:MAG: peptidoglycan-binding protein [Proteobacteria bacterium]|nr:peptidoglycan-binding protein [Pseudomonadota bacterium]